MGEIALRNRNEIVTATTVPVDPRVTAGARFIAITGPARAGKTTTLMKLAAWECAVGDRRVGIVSATGRAEPLQTYAKSLGCPFAVAPALSALSSMPREVKNCDLVLIDTAGTGWNCAGRALRGRLGDANRSFESETLLVLPADVAVSRVVLDEMRFRRQGVARIILTKLDKCREFHALTAALFGKKGAIPLAFLARGERVPFDIEPASQRRIDAMLSFYYH